MRFLCFDCCFRTCRLRDFSDGFRRCFRSRVCVRILRFPVGRIILSAFASFGRCLRFRHRFLNGDIPADPVHRVQLVCRLDVVDRLIGSCHTGGKISLVRILRFIEVHLYLILVRDLQVCEILLQIDFRIKIHLVILSRDNLFRIQLILHLIQLRQSFHLSSSSGFISDAKAVIGVTAACSTITAESSPEIILAVKLFFFIRSSFLS